MKDNSEILKIGWAQADITPDQPVLLAGQFHSRVSEGVKDPVTITVLAIDSSKDHLLLVSCDLVSIPNSFRDAVRTLVSQRNREIDPMKIILHATHTHTAPEVSIENKLDIHNEGEFLALPVMSVEEYVAFATERIADVIEEAWNSRKEGSTLYGKGYAVVGRNRRWVNREGISTMYGKTDTELFSHIEGYEDHSVNLLVTKNSEGLVTGLVVNIPCPSQEEEGEFRISADYWHDVRVALRKRFGEKLFILAQCSAAGDQSPHLLYEKEADARMASLHGRSNREEIAHRILSSVEDIMHALNHASPNPPFLLHHVERMDLPQSFLTSKDMEYARKEADRFYSQYEEEKKRFMEDPDSYRKESRWYCTLSSFYRRMRWYRRVIDRFNNQQQKPTIPTELHIIRLGDIAIATNCFEYYLDFGIYIKAQSKAVQTFLVQLAGAGTYVPSNRSVAGGGYGSVPASNPVGSDGGWKVAERTVEILSTFWKNSSA